MDTCHLILGRPWKFDVKSQHNGERNTYLIELYGRKFKMAPLLDQLVKDKDENSIMLIRGKEFLQMTKKEDFQSYALVMKPKDDVENKGPLPVELQKLLKLIFSKIAEEQLGKLRPIKSIKSSNRLNTKSNIAK